MSRTEKIIAILFGLLLMSIAGQYLMAQDRDKWAIENQVYQICNTARQEYSGQSEQQCGDAQDRTHTEFLCETNDSLPSTHCWVEERSN